MTATERMLSVQDMADMLDICYSTAYRMVRAGRVRYYRVGRGKGLLRIPISELDRLMVEEPTHSGQED